MKAQSSTMTIMSFVYLAIILAFFFLGDMLQDAGVIRSDVLIALLFLIYGTQELMVGIKFRKLEAE